MQCTLLNLLYLMEKVSQQSGTKTRQQIYTYKIIFKLLDLDFLDKEIIYNSGKFYDTWSDIVSLEQMQKQVVIFMYKVDKSKIENIVGQFNYIIFKWFRIYTSLHLICYSICINFMTIHEIWEQFLYQERNKILRYFHT